ncbi:MAG TPA: S9 family peptidase [Chloroflexota bacterium]
MNLIVVTTTGISLEDLLRSGASRGTILTGSSGRAAVLELKGCNIEPNHSRRQTIMDRTTSRYAAQLCIALLACACVSSALAKAAHVLPPLIDRELFFGDPEITGAELSPDGAFISFLKPLNGVRNIWVKRTDAPFDQARPISNDRKRPISGYFWSRDSKYVLYVQDQAGDENFNVYAVDPQAPVPAGAVVPVARNLTDVKGVRAAIYAVPKKDPDTIYIGLNDRDKAWHDLYSVRISTGERTLLRKNDARIASWKFDLDGQLRLAQRAAENGDTEILRVDASGFSKIYSCSIFEACDALEFTRDGRQVYLITNHGEQVDLMRLMLLDVQSGREEFVESDPHKRVDLSVVLFSPDTDQLVGTGYIDDKLRIVWREKSHADDYQLLLRKMPGLVVTSVRATRDDQLWLVTFASDVEPGITYLFDRKTKSFTLQFRLRESLPREQLAHIRPVRYHSSDGLEIPAYLTLPVGRSPKALPLVVVPHGGPWGRDSWGYHPVAQFFANRGFAVLQPNFRASTGYGKKFVDAGNHQWGRKMQDDITWGVRYLISQGIADPKRVAITGGSYGGYATLAGVTFTPDLYAAAVSNVGPSNLITLLKSIPPYWEAGRRSLYARVGDPTTPAGREQLTKQSPLNFADRIKTPLMVVQGANDPRVNKSESDRIVIALRDRGFPVKYLVAENEGHGFATPLSNIAVFAEVEQFFAAHLGTRFQATMSPAVAERVKLLTVDPASVATPKAAALEGGADSGSH